MKDSIEEILNSFPEHEDYLKQLYHDQIKQTVSVMHFLFKANQFKMHGLFRWCCDQQFLLWTVSFSKWTPYVKKIHKRNCGGGKSVTKMDILSTVCLKVGILHLPEQESKNSNKTYIKKSHGVITRTNSY